MDPRKLSRADLVDFATNAAQAVADGRVPGFLAAQNTSISEALTDATAELAAADTDQVTKRTASLDATEVAGQKQDVVLTLLSELRLAMRSVRTPSNVYDAVGLTPPSETRTVVVPNTPEHLTAESFGHTVNLLTFIGNNPSGSVTYTVEAKIGDTAGYVMIGTTSNQKFRHTGVTPGEFYQYHVRAQSGRGLVSEWSNEAVAYGI